MSADPAITAERRTADRALLKRPLLVADRSGGQDLPLVRRHAPWLREYFTRQLGYRLVVEAGFARLYKTGLGYDPTHPATRPSGTPFTPRGYAYLALTAAALSAGREQVLLSALVAEVRAAAAEAKITITDSLPERRTFAAAIRHLAELGILTETEGTVAAYADDGVSEVLLTVNREILRHLVTGPLTTARDAGDLITNAAKPGVGGVRHLVRRRLVEHPVTYLDDLDDVARYWLRNEQRRESRLLAEQAGLEMEIRAEGVAVIDPDDELTDRVFPGTGTVAQAALLTIEALSERLRPLAGDPLTIAVPVPDGMLEEIVDRLADHHRRHWARAYVDDIGLLTGEVIDLLIAMGLLARAPDEHATQDHPGPYSDTVDGDTGQLEPGFAGQLPKGETFEDEEQPTAPNWQDAQAARMVRLRPERAVDVTGARGDPRPGQLLLMAAAARYAPVPAGDDPGQLHALSVLPGLPATTPRQK
jgi:uncharacterized protein (TIGR02678 family)